MKSIIHCIIVDDEPLARGLIETYVNGLENWKITRICKNASEAYEALCLSEADLVFLDIEMPVISGIEFLRTLKNPPLIIFTTAYSQYAVNAFDLGVVDYLLKPITEDRFLQAIRRAESLLNNRRAHSSHSTATPSSQPGTITDSSIGTNPSHAPTVLPSSQPNSGSNEPSPVSTPTFSGTHPGPLPPVDYVFFKQDSRLEKVMLADILYVEALKDFSRLHLRQRKMLVGSHLKLIEALLPADQFIRTHRSYLVSLQAVTAVQGNRIEIGKEQIPLGGNFRKEVFRRLNLPS